MSSAKQKRPRPHQAKADAAGVQMVDNTWPSKRLITEVVPGGGKTGLAIIVACRLLDARIIDGVIWVVPRNTLRSQVCESWSSNPWWNRSGYIVTPSENKSPLYPKDAIGCVASYQQVIANTDVYLDRMRSRRILLITDEHQLLADDDTGTFPRAWTRSITALEGGATFTVTLSGLLERRDGMPVPFVRYQKAEDGKLLPKADISYSLSQGIGDQAVRPPQFQYLDAKVSYEEGGQLRSMSLSDATPASRGKALATFLAKKETWTTLIDQAVAHWTMWRRDKKRGRLIVIAPDQESARQYVDYLRSRHGVGAALAISDDGTDARRAIDGFRENNTPEALVTVAMASIGYDVPDCTHLVYLSRYRSRGWALQAFARVWRMEPDVDPLTQLAWIFIPDDPAARELVEWIQHQTAEGIRIRDDGSEKRKGATPTPADWKPVSAQPTAISYGDHRLHLSPEQSADVTAMHLKLPQSRVVPPGLLAGIISGARSLDAEDIPEEPAPPPEPPIESRTHKDIKRLLHERSNKLDGLLRRVHGEEHPWGGVEMENRRGFVDSASRQELLDRIGIVNGRINDLKEILPEDAA